MDTELRTIKNVELFRTGTWKGRRYSERDLDDMVGAFPSVGYQVPIKLGHDEKSGAPAFGWVDTVRRSGDRLVGDFRDVPGPLADMIASRRYDHVSVELFHNVTRGQNKFPTALKAVALLGAETPAVADLKPLREATFSEAELASVTVYSPEDRMAEDTTAIETLRAELAAAKAEAEAVKASSVENAKKFAEDFKSLSDRLAARDEADRVRDVDERVAAVKIPALRENFRALYDGASRASVTVKFGEKAEDVSLFAAVEKLASEVNAVAEKVLGGTKTVMTKEVTSAGATNFAQAQAKVAELTAKKTAENPKMTYSEAVRSVLAEDAELKRIYTQGA